MSPASRASQHDAPPGLPATSGGLSSACEDFLPEGQAKWHSALGASYDCSWYARYDNCLRFGSESAHAEFGRTPGEACCACRSAAPTGGHAPAPITAGTPGAASGVSNSLEFLCSGAQDEDEVADALKEALLLIHGGESGALSIVVSQGLGGDPGGGEDVADWWEAGYQIVPQQGIAGMHLATATGMGADAGLEETATIMASAFAAKGLHFSKSSLEFGMPHSVALTSPTQTTWTASTSTQTETFTVASTSSALSSTSSGASSDSRVDTAANSQTTDTTTTTQAVRLDYRPPYQERWYDRSGQQYDCEWYERFKCPSLSALHNFGMVGRQACCACGGGVYTEDRRTPPPTTSSSPVKDEDEVDSMYAEEDFMLMSQIMAILAGAGLLCGCVACCVIRIKCPHWFAPDVEAGDKQADGATAAQQSNAPAPRSSSRPDLATVHVFGTMWWQADEPIPSSLATFNDPRLAEQMAWRRRLDDPNALEAQSHGHGHPVDFP